MARLGTARLSSALFAFPLQFSTALEWVGLYWSQWPILPWLLKNIFIPRCSIKLSLDLLLGYQQEEHLYLLNRQWNGHFLVVPHVASSMKQAVTIFSGQSVISRVYMSCFVNGTVHLEPQPRWYWKMYQVLYPVEPPKSEPYRTMQWKSDICGSTLILFFYSCLQRNQMTLFKNVFSSVSFFEARSHTCNVLFSVKYHFKQFSLYRSFFFFFFYDRMPL